MAALRIRNGLNLDELSAVVGGRVHSRDLGMRVRTEWLGGVQSLSTISRGGDDNTRAREFRVESDEPQERLGNDSAPAALELALAALGASFAEAFVVQASAVNVGIDALIVDIQTAAETRAILDGPRALTSTPKLHLLCGVESAAPLARLREIGRRARALAPVLQLYRPAPSVTVTRAAPLPERREGMI